MFAQARPEDGYSYSTPSNTYGAPGGGLIGAGVAPIGAIGPSSGVFGSGAGAFGNGSRGGAFGFVNSGTTGGGIVSGGSGGDDLGTGGGYDVTSLIQKHIYVHVPLPEPKEHISQRVPQFRPAQKHYNFVFIKVPTPPTPTAANIQLPGQDEQMTIIYVLVKKPDESEALNI